MTRDIEALRFNTAISAMMILVKHLGGAAGASRARRRRRSRSSSRRSRRTSAKSSGSASGTTKSLAYEPWPTFDPALVKDDVVEIGVQVNGKVRGAVTLAVDADEATRARGRARRAEASRAHVEGKTVKKFIYVPGKIVNFIVA